MDIKQLSKRLTVRDGGIFTGEIATAFSQPPGKVWQVLRDLELKGVLTGEARDKRGDYVERKDDGAPATVGGSILWFAPVPEDDSEGESPLSMAAATQIYDLLKKGL